jgi:hypothetical protein
VGKKATHPLFAMQGKVHLWKFTRYGFQRALGQKLTHEGPKWFGYQMPKLDCVVDVLEGQEVQLVS